MKIYLASPFFNDNEIANIHRAAEILKAKGHEVFVPMEHDVENRESLTNAEWAEEIFKIDKGGIDDCDAVVLLYGGMYSDSGTAWECGYAYATGKKVIVCCYNIEQTNLMIVNGCHAFLNGIDELSYYDFDKMPVVRNAGNRSKCICLVRILKLWSGIFFKLSNYKVYYYNINRQMRVIL